MNRLVTIKDIYVMDDSKQIRHFSVSIFRFFKIVLFICLVTNFHQPRTTIAKVFILSGTVKVRFQILTPGILVASQKFRYCQGF